MGRGVSHGAGIAARESAGHWSATSEQLHCASLILYILLLLLLLLLIIISLCCPIKLSLSQLMSFMGFFLILLLIPPGQGGWQAAARCLVAG